MRGSISLELCNLESDRRPVQNNLPLSSAMAEGRRVMWAPTTIMSTRVTPLVIRNIAMARGVVETDHDVLAPGPRGGGRGGGR